MTTHNYVHGLWVRQPRAAKPAFCPQQCCNTT